MFISTKGRYGLRAMLELALGYNGEPVSIRDISKSQDISEKYLENILSILKNAKLVISRRGAKGGYAIAKPPEEIKLIQVINTLEGSISPVDCVDENICKKVSECVLYDVWKEIKDVIEKILSSITLKDLVDKYKNKKKRKK